MILWGTVVNVFSIILGSLLGCLFRNINEKLKTTIMQVIGFTTLMVGLRLAMETSNIIILIVSLIIGVVIGTYIGIEDRLHQVGQWIEKKIGSKFRGNIVAGFVSATLVFSTGAMSVLGPIDSGLSDNNDILYFKSMLDGVTAIVLTSSLGIGVLFASIPVLFYQGCITILAYVLGLSISNSLISEITLAISSVGGILLMGIGCNVSGLLKVHVGNMLPAIFVAVLIVIFS
ncbi:DUF554 domain-containing protein [Ureibacillus composti]